MNTDIPRPVWRQVADTLADRIRRNLYRPGQRIPSESQLAGEFGIARGTARKVVAHLRRQGMVFTVPVVGTFVAGTADAEGREAIRTGAEHEE